jgi:hypothetical protein
LNAAVRQYRESGAAVLQLQRTCSAGTQMRAAALAAAVIAAFLGAMYLRFSGDTVPAPPTPGPYAGQPTCVVFRPISGDTSAPLASCGGIDAAFDATPFVLPTAVPQFLAVRNTEGDCLNIRAEPGSAGRVLACEAEGVMLGDLLERLVVEGVPWARVRTSTGIEGWASTQYLER